MTNYIFNLAVLLRITMLLMRNKLFSTISTWYKIATMLSISGDDANYSNTLCKEEHFGRGSMSMGQVRVIDEATTYNNSPSLMMGWGRPPGPSGVPVGALDGK